MTGFGDPAFYGDRWADVYDEHHGWLDPAAAVEFLAGLAGDGPVLELAIGTGRVALPLAGRGVALCLGPGPPDGGIGRGMLTRRIIPCLDVDRGKVIRGVKFSADRVVGDPIELAAQYNRQGADELVFYDITASAEDRGLILDVLHRAAGQLFIPLTVGGGVRTAEDIKTLLRAGADKVSVNTQAVLNPGLIAEGADRFGSQCIVLSMDVLWNRERGFYEIVTHGGRNRTSLEVLEWAARGVELGAGELVVNSIDADGTREGYELRLTRMVAEAVSVPVVASGGAGSLEHLYQVLDEGKADAALAASIFHYGDYTIEDAKLFLAERGVPVRLPVNAA